MPADDTGTLVIVQSHRPDQFFTAQQQRRLSELMARWRAARDAGDSLPPAEQAELDALVDAEVRASGQRAAASLPTWGMNPRYAPVAERAGHRCEYCRAPEAIFNFPFEVEHIVPTSTRRRGRGVATGR